MERASFGQWLRERRKSMDLTQEELALRIGCSPVLVRKLEAGERRPSKQIAELLAQHLGIPRDEHPDFSRFARSSVCLSSADPAPWRHLRLHLTNLPVSPTPLVGREQDVEVLKARLLHERVRLLTLTGPPGIGKTRLAYEVAGRLLDDFPDGVWQVPLASIREPELVPVAIAHTLGVREAGHQTLLQSVKNHVADKRLLLLLDNFEQILPAAPLVADLIEACPWLQVLATSRASLHVRAERQFLVPSLLYPQSEPLPPIETLRQYPAVALFLDRAQAVDPEIELTEDNASAIAGLCARLDGLPLAIEIVAARISEAPPQELLDGLGEGLALSSAGLQDMPPRHQSLRDAIRWSFDLLNIAEQRLFARLAVFVGGCTFEAARVVCQEEQTTEPDLQGLLRSLVDKSLVTLLEPGDEPRYVMLETIGDYASEQLVLAGDQPAISRRHALYYLHLAELAHAELAGKQQGLWLERLAQEQGNLRATFKWALASGAAEEALQLAAALWRYWYLRGDLNEGRSWSEAALALPNSHRVDGRVRARALNAAGVLAWAKGDYVRAKTWLDECLALQRERGDQSGIEAALNNLANVAREQFDLTTARALHEESLALARLRGNKAGIASSLNNLGLVALDQGDSARAVALYEESLRLQREQGEDPLGLATTLNNLGTALIDNGGQEVRAKAVLEECLAMVHGPKDNRPPYVYTLAHLGRLALYRGDLERAAELLGESYSLARAGEIKSAAALALLYLGQLSLRRGEYDRARQQLGESLSLSYDLHHLSVTRTLAILAQLAWARGQTDRAVALLGSVDACCTANGIALPPVYQAEREEIEAASRAVMGQTRFQAARAEGLAKTLEQMIEYALSA